MGLITVSKDGRVSVSGACVQPLSFTHNCIPLIIITLLFTLVDFGACGCSLQLIRWSDSLTPTVCLHLGPHVLKTVDTIDGNDVVIGR